MPSVRVLVRSAAFVLAGSLALVESVQAADCAVHTLLKVGTTFPIKIAKGGCYRLSANVVVPNANTTGVKIIADDVRLNLNGHQIIGPNTCSGTPTTCTLSGTGIGIDAINTENVVIRDGSVRGHGAHGIRLGQRSQVINVATSQNTLTGIFGGVFNIMERVIAEVNGGQGIVAGDDCSLKESVSRSNGKRGVNFGVRAELEAVRSNGNAFEGILVDEDATLEKVLAFENLLQGIKAGDGATIHHGKAHHNHGDGIQVGKNSNVEDSSALDNEDDGIKAGLKSKIKDSEASENGANGIEVDGSSAVSNSTAHGNGQNGIVALGPGDRISETSTDDNEAIGMALQEDTAFDHNSAQGNKTSDKQGGIDTGGNVCSGALCTPPPTCP